MKQKSKVERQNLDDLERRLMTKELCLYEEALHLTEKGKPPMFDN